VPPAGRFVQSVEVSVASLDAVVTDEKGQRVPGLTAADFEILEDGKRKEISNFFEAGAPESAADPTGPDPAPATSPTLELPRATYVVLIDNIHLQPGARNAVFESLEAFLRRELGPNVQAAVATNGQGGFRLRSPVTGDADALVRLLRTVANEESSGGSFIVAERNQVLSAIDTAGGHISDQIQSSVGPDSEPAPNPTPGAGGGGAPQQAPAPRPPGGVVSRHAQALQNVWPQVRSYSIERVRDLETTLSAVRILASRMSGLEGRKVLFLVSGNLPLAPGLEVREYFHEAVRTKISGGQSFQSQIRSDPESTFDRTSLFGETASAAAAAGFSVFVFDGKGAGPAGGLADSRMSRQSLDTLAFRSNDESMMRSLAESTGGLAAIGRNRLGDILDQISEDARRYYSLGYATDPLDPKKKSRSVEVRVKRAGLTIRWQRTAVPRNFAERLTLSAVTALFTPRIENPLRAKLRATPIQEGKKLFHMVKASIPWATLSLLPDGGKRRGVLLLNAAFLTDADTVSDVPPRRANFSVDATQIEASRGQEMLWETKLEIPVNARRISIALTDETARATSYFQADLPSSAPPK